MAGYTHTQSSTSVTWTIVHNLACDSVNVDVIVDDAGDLKKAVPSKIVHTDNNTTTVTLSATGTGVARVQGEI